MNSSTQSRHNVPKSAPLVTVECFCRDTLAVTSMAVNATFKLGRIFIPSKFMTL